MPNTNDNFDTYPFKENGDGNPGGGSPTSTQGAELKVTTLTSSDFNDSNKFSFHHNKGTLKFVNIRETIKNTFSTSSFVVPDTHTTKFSVKNDTTLTIHRPLVLRRKSDDRLFTPKNLTSLPFSMSFENVVTTPATSSDYLNSYADITIGNLRTFSGDVHKVKLFTKQQDKQNQEFEKIGEFVLQSKNTLVDESSPTADDPIGIFYSQSVIDNHWVSSSNSTTADNSLIMNAALISGSNRGADDFVEFKTKDRFELEKGEEYILSFSGYFIKGDKVQSDGSVRKSSEIEVLLSGSVVSQTEDTISIGSIGDVGDSSSELFKGNVSGSIPYLYNYVYTHKKSGAKPKAGLVFRVHAGQFHLSNIKFEAVSDQNFNPGFYKTRVPMPIATRRGQRYDFVSEFYDFNNNKAKIEAATSASVLFAGPKQVLADGEDAIFSGSAMIGQSIQMYGVNPAFLRSVGYNGFDKTLAGTGDRDGGFLLWSGSVGSAIGSSETYNGVGFEIVQKGANPHQNSFLQFASKYKGGTTSRFRVQTDEFLLGRSGSGTAGDAYISGSNGNLEISSSNFLVSASGDVIMQGTITATAGGTIGGFTVGSNTLAATNFTLDTSLQSIVLGSGNNILIASASQGLSLGHATFASAPFRVTPAGALTATSATITGAITATSGQIAGWTIDSNALKSTNNKIILEGDTSNGQIKIGSATALNTGDGIFMDGGGDFRVGDADGNRIAFDQSAGLLVISSSTFMIGSKANGKSFISASDAYGLEISSSNFHLSASGKITASAVKLSGDITAQTGNIGGFTIDTDEIKAGSTLILDSDTNSGQIKLGGATSITAGNDGVYMDGTGDFRVGDADGNRISFDQSTGILILSSSDFFLGSKANGKSFISSSAGGELEISSSFFHLSSSGHITGSKVLFDGGVIGGWTIGSNTLTGGNTTLNSNGTITLGASANSNVDGTNRGIYMDAGGDFLVFGDSSNFIRFDVSDNDLDIKTAKFKLDTDRLDIDSDNSRISVFDDTASPKEVVRIGQVDGAVDSSNTNYGMKIFDGTGTDDTDILVEFSETENNIAGWDISTSTISKNNLILNSAGQISSQGYASNQQGFFLGMRPLSDGSVGAFLEVDEANIRGTLKTTVFEKETVNAVGGQLHVANATTITGSVSMSTTDTTMQVANASGFSSGEIIQLKKFNPTGFTTEYMKIHSVSLKDAGSETNFSGSLVVTRSLGTSAPTNTVSSSIGFSGSSAQSYTPGQVIVSTGKIGTGYIRLNANPNDQTTPYMDIVERTGSGVYDINLKARLGDLSGVVDTINGQSVSGFGLYTDNAFLKGGIVASYGSIGGFNMSSTDLWAGNATLGNAGTKIVIGDSSGTPKIALGGQANNITLTSGDGVFIDGNGNFRVGDVDGNRIIFDGTNFAITSSNFGLETSTMHISSSNGGVIAMGSTIPKGNDFTDNGIMLSGSGEFNFQLDSDNFIRRDGNELNLKSEVFGLKTSKMVISSSLNNGTIALGSTPPTSINYTANSGIYMDGNGDFLVRGDNDNFIKFDVSDELQIAAENFELDAGGLKLIGNSATAANNQIRLGSATALNTGDGLFASGDGKFRVGADNGHRLEFDGTNIVVSASDFFLGSKGSNNAYISSSGNVLEISSSKFALKKDGDVSVEGTITATDGAIGGFYLTSTDLYAGNATLGNANTKIVLGDLTSATPKFALGATANSITLTGGNDGVYMDGGGDFRVGDADGERISFDASAESLVISSSTFMIGSKANGKSFISASDAYGLEISSSNFHLSASGKITASAVKLSGDITATTGNIGGFTIDDDEIKAGSTLILDSDTNSGEIKLGGATSITGGTDGIYMNGTGDFRVGDADGSRIVYDKTADTITISSSIFDLTSTVSGRTLQVNNTTPSILIESSSGGSVVGKVLLTANPGQGVGNQKNPSFVVSQSGMPIFSVGGEDHKFISKRDVIVNSLPIQETGSSATQLAPGDFYQGAVVPTTQNSFQNSSDTNTATAGGGAPTVKVANMLVASQFSASRMTANNTFFLSNTAATSSANTKYNIHIDDKFASGSGLESSPAVTVFDIRRNYKQFNRQDAIPQAMVFSSFVSTELDAGEDSPRFVPNGGVSGSAIFHFQSILAEGSAGGPSFADGKKCIMRIDSDVRNSGASEKQFVFIEGRAASGSFTHPTPVWQIQADGDFVTRGDITAFGVNSNFNTVSDRRFKKDVHTISGSMDKILQLRPTEFTWIEKNKQDVGFIAQEVEEIIPEVINTATGMIEEGKETQEVKTISYPKLVPYLVDTIQQLNKRIEELEKKVK